MTERRATDDAPTLGVCPSCEAALPTTSLVVRYDAATEWPRMLAACRGCDEVVHPR